MSAVPVWLLEEETEEIAELELYVGRAVENAKAGGYVDADVIASDLLRRQGDEVRQIAQLAEAKAMELALATARISQRYDAQIARHQERAGFYERAVVAIAETIPWHEQPKKSRAVGFGTYGVKREPERVKIVDQEAAVAFARVALPSAIKEKMTLTVDHRAIAPAVLARVHGDGEVPAGFSHESERQVFFARPEVN